MQQRTREGNKLITKKSLEAKAKIQKYPKDFGGILERDEEVWTLCSISRNTYYKYKREILQ